MKDGSTSYFLCFFLEVIFIFNGELNRDHTCICLTNDLLSSPSGPMEVFLDPTKPTANWDHSRIFCTWQPDQEMALDIGCCLLR